jgi:hypothetical protein
MQQAFDELQKARLPEDRRLEVTLADVPVRLRITNIVEDGACAGILVIVETKAPSTSPQSKNESV